MQLSAKDCVRPWVKAGIGAHRNRQQDFMLIAEIHQRSQRQPLRRRKLQIARGDSSRQMPVHARRLSCIAGVDPVNVPARVQYKMQASQKIMNWRDAVRFRHQFDSQMRRPYGCSKTAATETNQTCRAANQKACTTQARPILSSPANSGTRSTPTLLRRPAQMLFKDASVRHHFNPVGFRMRSRFRMHHAFLQP